MIESHFCHTLKPLWTDLSFASQFLYNYFVRLPMAHATIRMGKSRTTQIQRQLVQFRAVAVVRVGRGFFVFMYASLHYLFFFLEEKKTKKGVNSRQRVGGISTSIVLFLLLRIRNVVGYFYLIFFGRM